MIQCKCEVKKDDNWPLFTWKTVAISHPGDYYFKVR